MAILYTDLTDSIIIEHTTLDEYILHVAPVFQHWRLTIIMDGFFPCDMGKCRKLCKMLYDFQIMNVHHYLSYLQIACRIY